MYRELGITELVGEEALALAFEQIEAGLLRIAVDVRAASTRGVDLADAVRDDVGYPHLYKAHIGLSDLLARSVPPELEQWVRRVLRMPLPPIARELRHALARMAAGKGPTADAARFLLFEAARFDLLRARWDANGALEQLGVEDRELDVIADCEVNALVAAVPQLPDDVDPCRILTAASMVALTRHAELMRELMRDIDRDIAVALQERAEFERLVRTLEPVDAVLLRNEVAPRLGEQHLSTKELRRAHPVLLDEHADNALDQRLSRLRRRIQVHGPGGLKPRARPSLLSLLTDLTGGNQ